MSRSVFMAVAALTGAGVLAAGCGPRGDGIAFRSQQEETCYNRAKANLAEGKELRRDSAGRFVEVTIINSQVRDIDPSEAFNNCMVSETDPGSITDLGTVTFTGEDLTIWNSLSDDAKKRALEFIRNGGTLREFVAI